MGTYSVTSRAYLKRALHLLSTPSEDHLFYAAFELRCGIEARLQEYLEPTKQKIKQGWNIAKLTKAGEKSYLNGPRVQRIAQLKDGKLRSVLYFTPVSPTLALNGKKLGNYLHALESLPTDKGWWKLFRALLSNTADGLTTANTGTLIGPVLMSAKTRTLSVQTEYLGPEPLDAFYARMGKAGEKIVLNVSYIDKLPDPIEPQAIRWVP